MICARISRAERRWNGSAACAQVTVSTRPSTSPVIRASGCGCAEACRLSSAMRCPPCHDPPRDLLHTRGFQCHQDNTVCAGLVDQQIAFPRRPHVPHDAGVNTSGGDGPALEALCRGVEAYERVRPLPRFVVPDDTVRHRNGVGVGLRSTGRGPFLHLARLRVETSQTALRRVDIPDHPVTGDIEATYRGLLVWQAIFLDGHGLRIDFGQAVAAIAGDPQAAVGTRLDAIGPRLWRRHWHQRDLAGAWNQTAHKVPRWSKTAVCGSRAAGSGILYSVTMPVCGSSLPIVPLPLPVYQMLPSWSGVTLWGLASAGNGYSRMSPVSGLIRPTRLPHCPAHQIDPSSVCTGSRARWPSVGTFHSRNVIEASPGTRVGCRWVRTGKCVARYSVIVPNSGLADRSIMLRINSRQPSRVYPELRGIWSVVWHPVQMPSTSAFPAPAGNGTDWPCWVYWPCASAGTTMKHNAPANEVIDRVGMRVSPRS